MSLITLSTLSFASGTVKTYGEGLLTLKAETLPKNTSVIHNVAPLVNSAEQYVIYNTSNGTVTKGVISDLVGENSGKPSNVVCRLNYYEITDIFIYDKMCVEVINKYNFSIYSLQ